MKTIYCYYLSDPIIFFGLNPTGCTLPEGHQGVARGAVQGGEADHVQVKVSANKYRDVVVVLPEGEYY